jgi:RNA polymerase sigma factor (sigma-70 family)
MPAHDAPEELRPLFVTTRWSVVLAAQNKSSPASAAAALETLCGVYWYPLYALVRRQGHSPHDAQDLTQEFFARLLSKDYLQAADREKGRLRTFLHVALKRFLANEWDRAQAQKRGGGQVAVAFDTAVAEQRYQQERADTLPPDRLYERQWAMTLLEQAMTRLRAEHVSGGREAEFESLKSSLTAERGTSPYGEMARALNLSEGAARVAVHRLRKRFRELFRAAVADTVEQPAEVDDELRYVAGLLGES